ncbi:MAG: GNAT family N-acetyltransferase [bacterium]
MSTDLEEQAVAVRRLRPADLDAVVLLDAKNTGRTRDAYFKVKLEQNLAETGIQVSLAAELQGAFVGFLLARVFYGEFGMPEPVAVLETFGVHPDFRGLGVGSALLGQLRTNLRGLGIPRLRTDVGWDDQDLLGFFHHEGFRPALIFCLELDLTGLSREAE